MVNNTLSKMLAKAITIAATVHEGQKRWNGEPYILHPLRVMNSLLPRDGGEPSFKELTLAILAVLHDVVEDTDITLQILEDEGVLNTAIVGALSLLTKEDYPKDSSYDTKDLLYMSYIDDISYNELATLVKLADLHDNMNIKGPPQGKNLIVQRLEKYRRAYFKLKSTNDYDPWRQEA